MTNTKAIRDHVLGDSLGEKISDFPYLIGSELAHSVLLSGCAKVLRHRSLAQDMNPVQMILARSAVDEVGEPVIALVSVKVVDLLAGRAKANESLHDHAVKPASLRVFRLSIPEIDLPVADPLVQLRSNHLAGNSVDSGSNVSNPSKVRYFVEPFVVHDGSPNLNLVIYHGEDYTTMSNNKTIIGGA